MSQFSRDEYQRAISEAYRASNKPVKFAIKRLHDMIDVLTYLEPKCTEELHSGAAAVIEEFSND